MFPYAADKYSAPYESSCELLSEDMLIHTFIGERFKQDDALDDVVRVTDKIKPGDNLSICLPSWVDTLMNGFWSLGPSSLILGFHMSPDLYNLAQIKFNNEFSLFCLILFYTVMTETWTKFTL